MILNGACNQSSSTIWLSDLDIYKFASGLYNPRINTNYDGSRLQINKTIFDKGIGVRAISSLLFDLDGKGKRFEAMVGKDQGGDKGSSVQFYLIGDRKILWSSGPMRGNDTPKKVNISLKGIKKLGLLVKNDSDNNKRLYGDWAEAKFFMEKGYRPVAPDYKSQEYICTPPAALSPKINGPKIFGVRPGSPFLFKVPATGEKPLVFSATGLPDGLKIDHKTGIITGEAGRRGNYPVILEVKNQFGKSLENFLIKVGDNICLTPPMGWNGWNSWAKNIDEQKVLASVNALVQKRLIDYGWTYINLDDTWQGQRGGKFNAIQPNAKFSHFKEMIKRIHSSGLKIGLYSTPWIASYAGYCGESSDNKDGRFTEEIRNNKRAYRYVGKYQFEKNDVSQWAVWGIDYLKYDWHIDLHSAGQMSEYLKRSGRDIVYSLSNSAKFENASDWSRLANCWRTGGDIRDTWQSLYKCGFTIDKWAPYAGPGHWNDPDMLTVGDISTGTSIHPTKLSPDEQYTQISLWSLLSAPLIIGCPVEKLDSFTLNLLTNNEVIAIDQDPLGKPARQVYNHDGKQIWIKSMADGSLVAGLFYTGELGPAPASYFNWGDVPPENIELNWSMTGIKGKYIIRDVWRQKDLGVFDNRFVTKVPFHGVKLIRLEPVNAATSNSYSKNNYK